MNSFLLLVLITEPVCLQSSIVSISGLILIIKKADFVDFNAAFPL